MAFAQIEPFGDVRADIRAGMVASPLLNVHIRKGSRRAKPSDFMLNLLPPEPQSPEDMKALLKMFASSHQGKIEREELP